MSLEIVKRIVDFIRLGQLMKIKQLMNPYSFDQKKLILSIDVSGSSLIYRAVNRCLSAIVTYFLNECGADPNSCGISNYERWSCLPRGIFLDSKDLVEILVSRGAAINTTSLDYKYPISITCALRNSNNGHTPV